MSKIRTWISLFKGMPDDLREDAALLDLIGAEDETGIMAYIEVRIEESLAEQRSFEGTHPELMQRWSRSKRDLDFAYLLSDAEQAELDWFDKQLIERARRTRTVRTATVRSRHRWSRALLPD
jgi:hypothetical protein